MTTGPSYKKQELHNTNYSAKWIQGQMFQQLDFCSCPTYSTVKDNLQAFCEKLSIPVTVRQINIHMAKQTNHSKGGSQYHCCYRVCSVQGCCFQTLRFLGMDQTKEALISHKRFHFTVLTCSVLIHDLIIPYEEQKSSALQLLLNVL